MKKIPIRKCRRCARFRNGYCPLEDLEPCRFIRKPKDMTRKETLEHAREIVNRIFHGHKDEVTLKGWVARDKSGSVAFFVTAPKRLDWGWVTPLFYLENKEFPSVKWEDEEPTEAEVTIRIRK